MLWLSALVTQWIITEKGPYAITSALWASFGMAESAYRGPGQRINPGSTYSSDDNLKIAIKAGTKSSGTNSVNKQKNSSVRHWMESPFLSLFHSIL